MLKMPKFPTASIKFSKSLSRYKNYDALIDGFTAYDRTPFTYLIEHLPTGLKYHGVRYAKNCSPSDMGKKYSSSSKLVWALLMNSSVNDIRFEIRKIFTSISSACEWENTVNRRLSVKSPNYLNIKSYVRGDKKKAIHIKTISIYNIEENIELRVPADIDISTFVGFSRGRLRSPIKRGTKHKIHNKGTRHEFYIGINDELPVGYVVGSMYRTIRNVITRQTISHIVMDEIPIGWVNFMLGTNRNAGTTKIINDGESLKSININDDVPMGWALGIIKSGNKGTTSYYDPISNNVIYAKSNLDIPIGYIKGNPNMLGVASPHRGKVHSYNPITDKLTMTWENEIPIGNVLEIPAHKNNVTEKGSKWYHNFKEEIMLYSHQEIPSKFIPGRLTKAMKHQIILTSAQSQMI